MKRWQLARGIVQGQSDLLDGWLQNKSYVDDILKKKSMDLLSKPRDMSVWIFFPFLFHLVKKKISFSSAGYVKRDKQNEFEKYCKILRPVPD